MRKALSILLLAIVSLPFFASALAVGQSVDAGLPACCRRSGAHHCAMTMAERDRLASASTPDLKWKAPPDRCPYAPASVVNAHPHNAFSPSQGQAYGVSGFSHPTGPVQTASRRRIARDRSRQKRGPPSFVA